MKKILGVLLLSLPAASMAATYTGHISVISMNNNGNNIVFEVANHSSEKCDSGWFKVQKPGNRELSPAELVVNAYYENTEITVHAPSICSSISEPAAVNRVTVGTSIKEIKEKMKNARKNK